MITITNPLGYCWSGRRDSNSRPLAPHASALPGCATPRKKKSIADLKIVCTHWCKKSAEYWKNSACRTRCPRHPQARLAHGTRDTEVRLKQAMDCAYATGLPCCHRGSRTPRLMATHVARNINVKRRASDRPPRLKPRRWRSPYCRPQWAPPCQAPRPASPTHCPARCAGPASRRRSGAPPRPGRAACRGHRQGGCARR